jgi:hypothetical protein
MSQQLKTIELRTGKSEFVRINDLPGVIFEMTQANETLPHTIFPRSRNSDRWK